ncbi:RNA polymerase sigma factor [Dehalobacterium formicoaceticum]|uniref:RNA polymerase sigma factor n=1 Tax=Dehalobacterium formicoaceticum TaxID=51515 RepID=UPI001FA93407|nr:sigma-70 family RNA polymerase sigma factor [Dehalobacterium formicoaceticum]
MDATPVDVALVKEAKKGNKDALVRLIMDEKQEYFRLAYAYTKNQADALDALADMIVILYEKISQLKNEARFDTWSRTILVNCCKDILRKKKKIIPFGQLPEISHEGEFRRKDEEIMLDSALAKLSRKHQEVLKLRFFLDFDYQTIADILKIPVGTVKSRISIGLAKLKVILGGEDFAGN